MKITIKFIHTTSKQVVLRAAGTLINCPPRPAQQICGIGDKLATPEIPLYRLKRHRQDLGSMDRPTTRAENVLLEADLWARSTSKCDLHSYHNFLNSSLFIKTTFYQQYEVCCHRCPYRLRRRFRPRPGCQDHLGEFVCSQIVCRIHCCNSRRVYIL